MFIALLLPSLYIAFSSFHQEMIPSRLVIAMAAGRSTVPFPSIIEALVMEVSIEILREASARLPGPIAPTIGIVGALVVGQAAVQAGIVSPRYRPQQPKNIDQLAKATERGLEKEAQNLIDLLQNKYKVDAIKLGSKVKAYHFKEWQKLDWKEEFPNTDITVSYRVEFRRTGMQMN
jgi:hypothetical protein